MSKNAQPFFEALPQGFKTTRYNPPADSLTQHPLRHRTARQVVVSIVIPFIIATIVYVIELCNSASI